MNNIDGNSVVLLSLETAAGKYPIEAVTYMNYIIIETQKYFSFKKISVEKKNNI